MEAKILIVDDQIGYCELVKEYIQGHGLIVDYCQNGTLALERASEGWDLFLLDILMPEMDGLTLCKKLREQKIEAPILFLTASRGIEVIKHGLSLGAVDYISKPFDLEILEARIIGHINRYRSKTSERKSASNVLSFMGGLEIDTDACIVKRNHKPIRLNAKEYELLLFMATNPGKVFSKEQLYTKIWKERAEGIDNTINVHISRLRKKIELNPEKPHYIQTRRNLGYCFLKE